MQPTNKIRAAAFDGNDLRAAELITQAAADADGHGMASQATGAAGSLDEVTRKLAGRLAARGGSEDEWLLLAQSYDYMGLTGEAAAARAHVASPAPGRAADLRQP